MLDSTPSWVGSVPTWFLLIVAIGAAWRLSRGGGGSAVQELSEANKVLTEALEKERLLGADRQRRIELLEHKTDVSMVLDPFIKWANEHEQADIDRHEITVKAFNHVVTELKKADTRSDERAKVLAKTTAENTEASLVVLQKISQHLDDLNGSLADVKRMALGK